MKFLFLHSWGGFCLAEWCLREALAARCAVPVHVRSLSVPPNGVPPDDLLPRALVAWRPDVVGLSCHYWSLPALLDAADTVKHLSPASRVVLGGPQVASTHTAEYLLSRHPAVDFVVRGPGEEPLCRLLEALARGDDPAAVPALSLRTPAGVVHAAPPPPAPWRRGPIFHADNLDLARRLPGIGVVTYETTRGCSEGCAYCSYPTPGLSLLDDDLVEAELRWLCALEPAHVRIADAHFAGSATRAKRFLRLLAQVNRCSSIKIHPALQHIDDEYLDLIEQAGAEVTSIGIQSTNPNALRAVGRRPAHDHAALARLLRRAPGTPVDLIVGLPGDDPAGLRRTFQDVIDLGAAAVNVFRLRIFPGTPLAAEPRAYFGSGPIALTQAGEVLFSPGFPRDTQAEVARLVHALELVVPLARTRRLFARSGPASRLLDLADHLDPETLMEAACAVTSASPARLLDRIPDLAAHLARLPGAPDPVAIHDAVALDVLDHCRRACRAARQNGFLWPHTARRMVRVAYLLRGGGYALWDLAAGTLARPDESQPLESIPRRGTLTLGDPPQPPPAMETSR